jgi:hypothetical protein
MQEHINMTALEQLAMQLKKNHGMDLTLYDEFHEAKQIEKARLLEFGSKVAMKAHTGQSGWSIIEVYNENK